MGKFFNAQGHVLCNSEPNSLVWPESELVQHFMPLLVICKFEENPIKNEDIIAETIRIFHG